MEYIKDHPEHQLLIFTKEVTAGAAAVDFFDVSGAPMKFEIIEVSVQPRGASANGKMTLKKGGGAITDAITCAVDKTIGRATTIDDAYSTVAEGEQLTIACAGDTVGSTKGLVTIMGVRR